MQEQPKGLVPTKERRRFFLAGLLLTTLATLGLEILDTRLLSVMTWYHLSFFAVSIAMFGMAAGAVHVYLGGARFAGADAEKALEHFSTLFAVTLGVSHVVNLCVPIPSEISTTAIASILLSTIVLTAPFYVSGIVVSIALTRIPGPIGVTYAVDLLGAALGSLLILPLLAIGNITSAAWICAALAAVGAGCFQLFAGRPQAWRMAGLAAFFVILAIVNVVSGHPLRVAYPKGRALDTGRIAHEFWSIHGQVIAMKEKRAEPQFWGRGSAAEGLEVDQIRMVIDGAAATHMTRWDGRIESIAWVQQDVTSLPFHLRRGGDVAIIGVGGGRDLLTALWAESRSVTGIEINSAFIHLLEGPLRGFSQLANRPEVRLVHDEARSYLTRTPDRYDVLQMSLIDSWAATGAGAFTLSENGLYTVEAWRVFLSTLKPSGLMSVSRWWAEGKASETGRLVSLAVASLFELGVEKPADHLVLFARHRVATLMLSREPFGAEDLRQLERVAKDLDFSILLLPGRQPGDELLGRIASSDSPRALLAAVADESFDYTPPTDQRPFFFNLVRPGQLLRGRMGIERSGGVIAGNMLATLTLCILGLVMAGLVLAVILWPLALSGLPRLDRVEFGSAVLYFASIGAGYMLIQIGFMQRFSIYLGHPTYAVAIILFSMILATGLGSLASEAVPTDFGPGWMNGLALATTTTLAGMTWLIQPIIESTIQWSLPWRCGIVIAVVSPISFLLGTFFPLGMRLVDRLSNDAMPWMWGVNGACGVLASVVAVAISMWLGIQTSFYLALVCYAMVALPAALLRSRAARA